MKSEMDRPEPSLKEILERPMQSPPIQSPPIQSPSGSEHPPPAPDQAPVHVPANYEPPNQPAAGPGPVPGDEQLAPAVAVAGVEPTEAATEAVVTQWQRFCAALGIPIADQTPLRIGRLVGQAHVQRDRMDRPPWARIVRALAWVPAILIIAMYIIWRTALAPVRAILRPFNPLRGLMPGGGLKAFGFGALTGGLGVGVFNHSRQKKKVWMWEMDCAGQNARVRFALPEEHGYDIRDGDELRVWGRRHRDGTVRAYKIANSRTGENVAPRYVHPVVWALAILGVVMVGALLVTFLFGGGSPTPQPESLASLSGWRG